MYDYVDDGRAVGLYFVCACTISLTADLPVTLLLLMYKYNFVSCTYINPLYFWFSVEFPVFLVHVLYIPCIVFFQFSFHHAPLIDILFS